MKIIINQKKFPFKIEWSGKNSKIRQLVIILHTRRIIKIIHFLLNIYYFHIYQKKWKGRWGLKIRFIDGNRLHWSLSNIEIMTSKQYNNHPNKNELTMLDEWVF